MGGLGGWGGAGEGWGLRLKGWVWAGEAKHNSNTSFPGLVGEGAYILLGANKKKSH